MPKRSKTGPQRWLMIGDLHCGSLFGLTPPPWHVKARGHLTKFQSELWGWFIAEVARCGPFDGAIWNGDLVDGPGRHNGGSEQITTNMLEQVEMAIECVAKVNAPVNHFTYGTAYHTGDREDFDKLIANHFKAPIQDKLFIEIGGVVFDIRHHASRGSVPYGLFGPGKERMWNALLSQRGEEPKADVVLRSHVHWYRYSGAEDYLAMTLPALQGPMTKYGRRCAGDYTMGFVIFDFDGQGGYSWQPRLVAPKAGLPRVVKA